MPYFNRGEATVTFASLGGGAWDSTVGGTFGDLLAGGESLVLTFDGDASIDPPTINKAHIPDRGAARRRSAGGPVVKNTSTGEGSFSITGSLTSFTSTGSATLMDVCSWATSHGRSGSYVEDNWEGSEATSAGSGDDCAHLIGVKYHVVDCADATDEHFIAWCYMAINTFSISEGEDVSTVSISGTIFDHPADILYGPRS